MPFICTLASGSSGNSTVLSDGETCVLIDAGISSRRICSGLAGFGIKPEALDAILITHDHIDHIKGLAVLAGRTSSTIYATYGTAQGILRKFPELESRIAVIRTGESFYAGSIEIEDFSTSHDASESVGFVFTVAGKRVGYATDLGCITELVRDKLSGAECLFIESNHDLFSLISGPYPDYLKRRIMSRRGHLSNDDCCDLLCDAVRWGIRAVTLCHLSKENNTPQLAEAAARAALERAEAEDVRLNVAPPDIPGEAYIF